MNEAPSAETLSELAQQAAEDEATLAEKPNRVGRPPGKKDTKPRKRPVKSTRDGEGELLPPGENARYIAHLFEVAHLEPGHVDFANAEQTEKIVGMYFQCCIKNNMRPSLPELAVAFHTTKPNLQMWLSGESFKEAIESREILTTAYAILNAQLELYLQNGRISPQAGAFLLKNNFGYEDKTEQVITPKVQQPVSPEELEKKYLAVLHSHRLEAPKDVIDVPIVENIDSPMLCEPVQGEESIGE